MSDRDRDVAWSGLCPSGRHGLDYRGQICDLCPPPPFAVWRQDGSDTAVRIVQAQSARQAAEQRAREDHQDPIWQSPTTYRVRDGATGQIWDVSVGVVQEPSFVALDAHEIEMPPATHVLWGGRVLCEDLRLRLVPRDWPEGQRWISLKDVAGDVEQPPDYCATCRSKASGLIEGLRQIGKGG